MFLSVMVIIFLLWIMADVFKCTNSRRTSHSYMVFWIQVYSCSIHVRLDNLYYFSYHPYRSEATNIG